MRLPVLLSVSARTGRASRLWGGALPFVLLLFLAACSDAGHESFLRGDRLLAEGDTDAAIAEYKLAMRQSGESPEIFLRLGHAYALEGDVDESFRYYGILLSQDSSYRYQAAADFAALGRAALERGTRENMARALQPLLSWSFGLIPADLQLELARYFWSEGDYTRALPLYLEALSDTVGRSEEIDVRVFYEAGRAYEELDGCARSLEYFETYLSLVPRSGEDRAGAEWHLGRCLFQVAQEDRATGRPGGALRRLDRMVELGVPQTLMDRAHFNRGELLLILGDSDRALAAFEEVLRLNPARSGPLVQRAEQRIRQIRFENE